MGVWKVKEISRQRKTLLNRAVISVPRAVSAYSLPCFFLCPIVYVWFIVGNYRQANKKQSPNKTRKNIRPEDSHWLEKSVTQEARFIAKSWIYFLFLFSRNKACDIGTFVIRYNPCIRGCSLCLLSLALFGEVTHSKDQVCWKKMLEFQNPE